MRPRAPTIFPSSLSGPALSDWRRRHASSSAGFGRWCWKRGPGAGAALEAWGHVRVFSPWTYNIDAAARTLLDATDWRSPIRRDCRPAASWCATTSRHSPRTPLWRRTWFRGDGRGGDAARARQGVLDRPGRRALRRAVARCGRRAASGRGTGGDRRLRDLGIAEPDGRGRLSGRRRAGIRRSHRLRHSRCAWPRPSAVCRTAGAGGGRRAFGDQRRARPAAAAGGGARHAGHLGPAARPLSTGCSAAGSMTSYRSVARWGWRQSGRSRTDGWRCWRPSRRSGRAERRRVCG